MVRAIDQRAIEGAMDDANDGSGSHRWSDVSMRHRRSDKRCTRRIREP